MESEKVEPEELMGDINEWLKDAAMLHQQLNTTHGWHHEEERYNRTYIEQVYRNNNYWIRSIPPNLHHELCALDWSLLIDNIRTGIRYDIETILSAYESEDSRQKASTDRYEVPQQALDVSHAILTIIEHAQRLQRLLLYLKNKEPKEKCDEVLSTGTGIQDQLLKQVPIINVETPLIEKKNGRIDEMRDIEAVLHESTSTWTRQDIEEYLSTPESRIRAMKHKGSIIGFVLYRLHENYMEVEEPIFDVAFDTTDLKVQLFTVLRSHLNNNRKEMRISCRDNDPLLLLAELSGFEKDGIEEGLSSSTHIMKKNPKPRDSTQRTMAAGIVHLVNEGQWKIEVPESFRL